MQLERGEFVVAVTQGSDGTLMHAVTNLGKVYYWNGIDWEKR